MDHARRFLVTGAGSGIGRAVALRLADEGCAVVLVGRRVETLEETLEGMTGEGHVVAPADVSDRGEVKAILRELERGGALEGVVACAGVGGPNTYGPDDRWDEILGINLTGTYNTLQECVASLKASEAPYAHAVVISSVLARLGVPGYSAYCASKAGLLGLVRSMAAEHARDGILVNALCPGWVDTAMAREGLEGFAAASGRSYEEVRAEQLSMVPLRKMSTPDEIAALVWFLVGGEQSSFTGQALDINNGAVMPA